MRYSTCLALTVLLIGLGSGLLAGPTVAATDNTPDWFYPAWVASSPFVGPILVRDTDSALGRYSLGVKELGLKDLARVHGHLCDGMVSAFVQLKAVLGKLFPDGIVDRTDVQVVSKNGPCWADTAAFMTGARINFQTMRLQNDIGDGFIVQRISTGEAWEVRLKPGIFTQEQTDMEAAMKHQRAAGKPVTAVEIDAFEKVAENLIRRLVSTPPGELLELTPRPGFVFKANDLFGQRGDIINKDMPR
ncbi:MAG: hypothetical protein GX442_00320 [Candidatus Riflebacteria bacterium]|nr:hypothetical protein [Candidatus Riflebacteria bacterium]